jgi:hypothetical protein
MLAKKKLCMDLGDMAGLQQLLTATRGQAIGCGLVLVTGGYGGRQLIRRQLAETVLVLVFVCLDGANSRGLWPEGGEVSGTAVLNAPLVLGSDSAKPFGEKAAES